MVGGEGVKVKMSLQNDQHLRQSIYSEYYRYLISIAYQMVGSMADAEDIVHDVFVKLSEHDWQQVLNVKAYLARATTNSSINFIKSSRRKRELYLGPWLPEPMLDIDNVSQQPEEIVDKRESVRYALVVLLQTLSPQERAVFIMRNSVGFTYKEIAAMLERSESNCRKLYSRAMQKVAQLPQERLENSNDKSEVIAQLFIEAIETGEYESLAEHLLRDAVLTTDGGGKVRAAYKPIIGDDRILIFLRGVVEKGAFDGRLYPVPLNSETGILLLRQDRNVMSIHLQLDSKGFIQHIYIILNPDKLQALQHVRPSKPYLK